MRPRRVGWRSPCRSSSSALARTLIRHERAFRPLDYFVTWKPLEGVEMIHLWVALDLGRSFSLWEADDPFKMATAVANSLHSGRSKRSPSARVSPDRRHGRPRTHAVPDPGLIASSVAGARGTSTDSCSTSSPHPTSSSRGRRRGRHDAAGLPRPVRVHQTGRSAGADRRVRG